MGRRDKRFHKDLKQQVYNRLTDMLKAGKGTSKKEAILDGTDKDKIFSYNTYQTYHQQCKYFASYITQHHPECTTLKAAKKYVNEWLQTRVDYIKPNGEKLSAWTIQTEAKALGKLYGIRPDDPEYFVAPKRERNNIRRSRKDVENDRGFSETNNDELIKFCKGTGCRRNILKKLEGRDLITKGEIIRKIEVYEQASYLSKEDRSEYVALKDTITYFSDHDYFIHHRKDKGGRERYAPIVGKNAKQIIERMQDTAPYEKVWQYIPKRADIHGYRGDYATYIYKAYARPLNLIPGARTDENGKKIKSELYICRKDAVGKKLDKIAMLKASKALGHNRLDVIANNYLRGL